MSEINTDLLSALKGLMETLVGDEFADDIPAVVKARAIIAKVEGSALDGGRPLPYDRDTLGRFVREAWVRWAETQPAPKPSWLAPYDELSEPDKEADRQIGEALARWTLIGESARLSKVEEHLRNIEATADAISSPQRMSIIRKQALLALAILGQAPPPAENLVGSIAVSQAEAKALLYGLPKHEFTAALSRLANWLAEQDDRTPCHCTTIQQDETCPVGYPSLLCETCDGKGHVSGFLPQDVINLVLAAREAFDTGLLPDDENRALDQALNAFSSRVPYENEPDVWP